MPLGIDLTPSALLTSVNHRTVCVNYSWLVDNKVVCLVTNLLNSGPLTICGHSHKPQADPSTRLIGQVQSKDTPLPLGFWIVDHWVEKSSVRLIGKRPLDIRKEQENGRSKE